jgi:hypothetical protein
LEGKAVSQVIVILPIGPSYARTYRFFPADEAALHTPMFVLGTVWQPAGEVGGKHITLMANRRIPPIYDTSESDQDHFRGGAYVLLEEQTGWAQYGDRLAQRGWHTYPAGQLPEWLINMT